MQPAIYEEVSAAFDFFNRLELRFQGNLKTRLIEYVAAFLPDGALVCDVGGGSGIYSEYLMAIRPDLNITMVEPSRRMLEIARQHLGDRVQYIHSDILRALPTLPEQDAYLFIRSFYAISEKIDDYRLLIKELYARLKSQGYLGIHDVNKLVDVEASAGCFGRQCSELGLHSEFAIHWPIFRRYLENFNQQYHDRKIRILDDIAIDHLLLENSFQTIFHQGRVLVYQKHPQQPTL